MEFYIAGIEDFNIRLNASLSHWKMKQLRTGVLNQALMCYAQLLHPDMDEGESKTTLYHKNVSVGLETPQET